MSADPLRGILDPVQVDNGIKRQAWDAYHGAKTPEEFRKFFDNAQLPQETKRALWNLKFQAPIETVQGAQQAIQQAAPQETYQQFVAKNYPAWSQAQARPDEPSVPIPSMFGTLNVPTWHQLQKSLAQAPPSEQEWQAQNQLWNNPQQAFQQMVGQMAAHPTQTALGMVGTASGAPEQGALPSKPTVDVQSLLQPKGKFGQGAAQGLSELTSPQNIGMLLTIPAERLIGLYYKGQMSLDTLQLVNQARAKYMAGDNAGAQELLGQAAVTGGMVAGMEASERTGRTASQTTPQGPARVSDMGRGEGQQMAGPGVPGQPTPVQIGPTQTANVGVEGGPRPSMQSGLTAAQEVTGRSTGAGLRAPTSAPIERGGTTAGGTVGTVTPKPSTLPLHVPEQRTAELDRRQTLDLPPAEGDRRLQDRRNINDVAREQMTQGLQGQPTPGQQLEQTMRQGLPKPGIDEAQVWQYITQKGINNPTWYAEWKRQFEAAAVKNPRNGPGEMLKAVQAEMEASKQPQIQAQPVATPQPSALDKVRQIQGAPTDAQRPSGLPQAPSNAPAEPTGPGQQPVRAAQAPAGPAGEPLPGTKEPVRLAAATPREQQTKPQPKPYVPLPPGERPRMVVGPKEPVGGSKEAPPPGATAPSAPVEIPKATPRPAGAMKPELESWKETRRTEAQQRNEILKQNAQGREPKADNRGELHKVVDRYLKSPGDSARRGFELDQAVEAIRKQGPEAIEREHAELSQKATRAEKMADWGHKALDKGVEAWDLEMRDKAHAVKFPAYEEGGATYFTGKTTDEGKPEAHLKPSRELPADEAEAIARLRGNTLKEVGTPRDVPEEEKAQLKTWEENRDRLVEEIRKRGGKVTEQAYKQLQTYITGIQSIKGTRFIVAGGPELTKGPEGALERTGTRTTQQMWNTFLGHPEGAHFARPSRERVETRVKELEREAQKSREIMGALKGEEPAEKAEPTKTPLYPSVEKAPAPEEKSEESGGDFLMRFFESEDPRIKELLPKEAVEALSRLHDKIGETPEREQAAKEVLESIAKNKGKDAIVDAAKKYGKALQGLVREGLSEPKAERQLPAPKAEEPTETKGGFTNKTRELSEKNAAQGRADRQDGPLDVARFKGPAPKQPAEPAKTLSDEDVMHDIQNMPHVKEVYDKLSAQQKLEFIDRYKDPNQHPDVDILAPPELRERTKAPKPAEKEPSALEKAEELFERAKASGDSEVIQRAKDLRDSLLETKASPATPTKSETSSPDTLRRAAARAPREASPEALKKHAEKTSKIEGEYAQDRAKHAERLNEVQALRAVDPKDYTPAFVDRLERYGKGLLDAEGQHDFLAKVFEARQRFRAGDDKAGHAAVTSALAMADQRLFVPKEPVLPVRPSVPAEEAQRGQSKADSIREQLGRIAQHVQGVPVGEDRTNLEQRLQTISSKLEETAAKMKLAMRNIRAMEERGEFERTYKDKDGKPVTETLDQIKARVRNLGLERSRYVEEHLPALEVAAKALSHSTGEKPIDYKQPKPGKTVADVTRYEPDPRTGKPIPVRTQPEVVEAPQAGTRTKAELIDDLKQAQEHLKNLINKSVETEFDKTGKGSKKFGSSAEQKGASDLRKLITDLQRQIGPNAPGAAEGTKETIEGQGLLKASGAFQKPAGERMTAGEPTGPAPEDPVADLHAYLNEFAEARDKETGALKWGIDPTAMEYINKALPSGSAAKTFGPAAEHLARPIFEAMQRGSIMPDVAAKRLERSLRALAKGLADAKKAPAEQQIDIRKAAVSEAKKIARGEGPTGEKGSFDIGKERGRGLEAAKRIREEREREEKGPFYSMSERVVRENWPGGPDAKASPKDIGGMLANAGVSKNELKWSDVDSYLLKAQKEGRQVTRKEVLDYLKEKNPRVEVTEKKFDKAAATAHQEKLREYSNKLAQGFEETKNALKDALGISDNNAAALIHRHSELPEDRGGSAYAREQELKQLRNDVEDIALTKGKHISIAELDKLFEKMDQHNIQAYNFETFRDSPEMQGGANGPRYESYSMPGGDNYREVLLRIPSEGMKGEKIGEGAEAKDVYHGPHFDEPNVVAHLRLKDRVDASGKKTLFIEEVQSDWARELREQQKKGGEAAWFGNPRGAGIGAPDMPFTEGHWLELAMKHVLKEAANKGYDKVAWTTGEQQAARYSLRKRFDRIGLEEDRDGHVHLVGRTPGNAEAYNPYNTLERNIDLSKLHEYVGRENAQKLLEAYRGADQQKPSRAYIEAKDFAKGGEHHLQLYDKMIPQFMERYGKKWGAKVGQSTLDTTDMVKAHVSPGGAEATSATVHSMDIPSAMRDVLKQPLRQIGGSQAGFVRPFGKKATEAAERKTAREKQAQELRDAVEQNKPHQIAQKLEGFVRSLPKGTVDERLKMANEAIKAQPSTGPGRVKQALLNARVNLKTMASWYWNGEKSGIKLRDAMKGNTDPNVGFKKALGHYNEAYQTAAADAHAVVVNMRKAHPQHVLDALHLAMDTNFDKDLLAKAASNEKLDARLRKAAHVAQNLTPEELGAAKAYSQFFEEQGQMLSRIGALRHMLENYVPHIVDPESVPGQKFMSELRAGVFDTNFKYAKQRIHETMLDGAQKGIKYQLGIDRAFWDYHRRSTQSIASRAFIKELNGVSQEDNRPALVPGYNTIQPILPAEYSKYPQIKEMLDAKPELKKGLADSYMFRDNRGPSGPIADVSTLEALGIKYNEKTLTENDKARLDVSDYKHVDHPDFKQTVYVGKGPDGKPVFYKADLYAHPAIYDHLKNIYEASQFRTNKVTQTALAVTAASKRLLLKVLPSGFHYSQEGLHSIGHGINPFKKDIWNGQTARASLNDPVVKRGLRSGLQLFDYDNADAMEGIKGVKGFEKDFENHLFGKFIPGLKIETFKKQVHENLEIYGKKGYSEDRIYEMTAQQINNAYGMQNRLFTGRTKFMQDLFRLTALAPDFLESRARFVGSAFRPGGRQQAMALMRLGLYMYGTARVLNAISNDGDAKWHPKDFFTWHVRGHEFSMRSVLTDAIFAATDPSAFLASRGALLPRAVFAEGQKAGTPKFLKDKQPSGVMQGLVRSLSPIVAQRPIMALMRKAYEQKNGPSIAWETFAGILEAVAGVKEKEETSDGSTRRSGPSGPHLPRMPRLSSR